jgi:Bcr/CflA subfamily drug resistance transporter
MKKLIEPPLLLLILLVGFPQISETIYTPSLPDLARIMGVGNGLVNLTLSIYFVGFAVGVLVWGRLSDRIGRRPAMLWGIGIYALGCLLCYASQNIIGLVLARFVQAFGASTGSVVTQTIMRDIYRGSRRSQVFSIISGAIALTPAVGPFIGGYIDELWGFYANFMVLLLMGIALFVYAFRALPETKADTLAPSTNLLKLGRRMFRDRTIWAWAFLLAACNGILFSYYGEAPFLFIELLNFTPSQYGMFGLSVALPIMLAALLSHRLNVRLSSESVILCGSFTVLVGACLFVGNASAGLISGAHGYLGIIALVLPMMIIFLGVGLVIPNCISLALQSYQDVLGSAGAIFGLMYYVMIAVMTELMGLLHNGSATPMAVYFLILSIMMSGIGYLKKKKLPHEHRTLSLS